MAMVQPKSQKLRLFITHLLLLLFIAGIMLSLIHISEPTRQCCTSRMPSSA